MEWPSSEIAEYIAFYEVHPWGEYKADARNGIACSLLANINKGKNGREFRPVDFMPFQVSREENLNQKAKALMEKFKNG